MYSSNGSEPAKVQDAPKAHVDHKPAAAKATFFAEIDYASQARLGREEGAAIAMRRGCSAGAARSRAHGHDHGNAGWCRVLDVAACCVTCLPDRRTARLDTANSSEGGDAGLDPQRVRAQWRRL